MKYSNIIFALFFLISCKSQSQDLELGSKTLKYELFDDQKSNGYELIVTLPRGFDKNKEYKVLYYLDAYWLSDLMIGTYNILELTDYVEEIVLVGISIDGSLKDWYKQRAMDFTPSKFQGFSVIKENLDSTGIKNVTVSVYEGGKEEGILLDENSTGGAHLFIEFLETDVFKFIEQTYPNIRGRRGVIGHSFGGLFSLYALQENPELFSDVILISPSASWNDAELLDKAKFKNFISSNNKIALFHSFGGAEIGLIKNSNKELNILLQSISDEQLRYKMSIFEEATHHTILSRAVNDGLLFIYGR